MAGRTRTSDEAGIDDRAVGEHVRRDRRQQHRVHGRVHDRPAGREVVGGRAGGARDDQAVGADAHHGWSPIATASR